MKKRNTILGLFLSSGLIVAGGTALFSQSKDAVVRAEGDQSEFTNGGQFTYSCGTGTLMSAEEVATEGVISSGYEGSVLKVSGANTFVSFDFAASSLKAKNVASVTFKLFASDPTSALTQCDFRIRKSSTQTTVVNEGAAGHSLLTVRNSWFTYELSSSKFYGGTSFESLADDNGYLHFETFFRTSASFDVYIDSVTIQTNLIEDDELVKNSDLTLFTPSDYNLPGNDTNPYYGDVGSALLDSFGFQLMLTVPSGESANMVTYLRICATSIHGSSPIYDVTLDHDNNVYAKFNGAIDWSSSIVISWEEGVQHLVEFYVIRTSDTTVAYLFGLDGVKIFKTVNVDVSSIDFAGHTFIAVQNGSTHKAKSDFDSCVTTKTKAINHFYTRRLANPIGSTWAEKYQNATDYYDNYLTVAQQTALTTESAYDYANRAYLMLKAEAETEALNAYKDAAKDVIESHVDINNYFPEDQTTVNEIISNGKGFIDDATTTDGVDAVVATYKDLLDGVKTEAQRKTAAKTELESYKNPDDYYPEEQQDIADIVALGKTQIDACTTLTAVNTTLAGAKGNLDNLQTKDQKDLAAAKNAAIEELNAIDAQKYYPDERMQVNNIRDQAIEDISDATTVAEVTTLKDNALAAITEIPTALEKEIAGAKEELGSYVNLEDYRADDQTRINNILTNAYAQLDRAESIDEVSDIVAGNKELLDAVPTDAERTAAELAEYKTEKKSWLEEQKATLLPNYREAEQQLITSYVADAKTQIDDASDKGGVDAAITAMQDKIALLKTNAQYNQEEADAVIALISAIPTLTPANYVANESSVTSARSAYDLLGDGAKDLVSNYAALQAAEARLAELKGEAAAAAQVDALISAIGTVTLDSETAINAARTAYGALNAEAQGMVKNLSVLTAAEARLAELKQAKSDAEAVEVKINAIGTVDASRACKDKIDDAYNSYQALSAEAKAMVSNKATLDSALETFDNAIGKERQAALDEIEEYVLGINMKKYSKDNQEEIQRLYEAAYALIQEQTYNDNLAEIVSDFKAAVEAIPQKKAAKKGCGGSIVATSVVLSTLSLAGLGLAISKKRKED